MTNDRLLSRLHTMRELALRDGDILHAAEYEKRINELLEEDRLRVMAFMADRQVFRLRPLSEPSLN